MNFTGNVSIKSDSPEFALNYILKNGGQCYLPLGRKIKQIKQEIKYPIINTPIYAIFDKKTKTLPFIPSLNY
ncbi:hypothetical protein KM972_001867 [Salmonella enterica]|nr:hypothetical protein [Salmonella enterica]EHO8673509.1 hypothetical protein [Salmonella enterica]